MNPSLCTFICPIFEIILVWWPVVFLAFAVYHSIVSKQEIDQLLTTIPQLMIRVWAGLLFLLILQLILVFSSRVYLLHMPYLPGPGNTLFFFLSIVPIVLMKRKIAEARI